MTYTPDTPLEALAGIEADPRYAGRTRRLAQIARFIVSRES